MIGLNGDEFVSFTNRLQNAFPDSIVNKWESREGYEEVHIEDSDKNIWEIKFFPARGGNE